MDIKSRHNGLIVDVEDDPAAAPVETPAQYCLHDCVDFLDLNVTGAKAARYPRREPLISAYAPKALGTARIGIDMMDRAIRVNGKDPVPIRSVSLPPVNVRMSVARNVAGGKGGAKSHRKVNKTADNREPGMTCAEK